MVKNDIRGIASSLPRKRRIRLFNLRLINWFELNGRKFPWRNQSASLYEQIVSEVLLQRTKADVVSSFFDHFIKAYPNWDSLAVADEVRLGSYLKPLGLWRRRASSLIKLGYSIAKIDGEFPRNRDEIERLPGIGQYIANAIELFANNSPRPLLDVNMARVLERYFGPRKLVDIRYDPYLQALAHRVVSYGDYKCINWAILDLGSMVCTYRQAMCVVCPLIHGCNYSRGMSKAKDDV